MGWMGETEQALTREETAHRRRMIRLLRAAIYQTTLMRDEKSQQKLQEKLNTLTSG